MNDADSPDQQIVPAPLEPAAIPAVIESAASAEPNPAPSEGWQTVDFPGAMSVDTIPHRSVDALHTAGWSQTRALDDAAMPGVLHYGSAEISPTVAYSAAMPMETADSVMQLLQQENASLRDRLVHVEQALVQQLEGQLAAAGDVSSAFEPTQERLEQLLQALERSQQATQRQQILVETLTEQLVSSQERIAQLERDCALTQQRHNEQVQQVLQAESHCRDLRLRLHRQQQQTLQFKAALEKCLEMPTAYGYPAMPKVALSSEASTPEALAALLPKPQPVKPWSLNEKAPHDVADQRDRSQSLLKLLNQGSFVQADSDDTMPELALVQDVSEVQAAAPFSDRAATSETMSTEPSTLLDSDDPQFVTHLMQLIFPTNADPSSDVAADALELDPLLDVSTFVQADLEAECADAAGLSATDASSTVVFISLDRPSDVATRSLETLEEAPQHNETVNDATTCSSPVLDPSDQSIERVWDDLATLIDPLQGAEHANLAAMADVAPLGTVEAQASLAAPTSPSLIAPEKQPQSSATTSTTAIPPIFGAAAATPADTSATTAQTAWTWRDRLVSAGKVVRSAEMEQAHQPAKLLALSATGRQSKPQPASVPQPTSVPSSTAVAPIAVAVTPSPIVYPQRLTKKLASLAAVDLPTFPKR